MTEGATLAIVGGNIQISGGGAPPTAAPPGGPAGAGDGGECRRAGRGHPAWGQAKRCRPSPHLGAIQIKDGARLDTSGEGAGTITIRGGSLLVDAATLASDTLGKSHGAPIGMDIQVAGEAIVKHAGNVEREMGGITTHAGPDLDRVSTGDAGTLRLVADRVQIVSSFLGSQAWQAGKAGKTVVQARDIMLSEGAQISGTTRGTGQGGTVTVTATETLTLQASGIYARTESSGAAGSANVQARDVVLSDGAEISGSTFRTGQGGTVTVMATETLTLRNSVVFANSTGPKDGAGNAGAIVVRARHIALSDGAQIGSGTFGPSQGGTITIEATETLTLRGGNPLQPEFSTGVFVRTAGAGNAGTVTVQARDMVLSDGGQIVVDTLSTGQGGTAQITVAGTLTMTGTGPDGTFASGIFASSLGRNTSAGAAGTIDIVARNVLLSDGAQIITSTSGGRGGAVTVTATETLTLRGTSADGTLPSGLSTRARGVGGAGTVAVQAKHIDLSGGAQLASSTFDFGLGGTLSVVASETLTVHGTDPAGNPSSVRTDTLEH